MKNQDIKIDLGAVQETLMLPLWARARETEKDNPVVCEVDPIVWTAPKGN